MIESIPTRLAALVGLEFRKLLTTRSTKILLLVLLSLGILVSVAVTLAVLSEGGGVALVAAVVPLSGAMVLAAPLLAVLVLTSDWQSRAIVSYYLHEPRRGLVFAAKLLVAVCGAMVLVTIAITVSTGFGLLLAAVIDAPLDTAGFGSALSETYVLAATGAITGAAVGALLLNTPLAMVVVILMELVLAPLLWAIPGDWADFVTPSHSLAFTSGAILPALTATFLWVVLPLAGGAWRNHRSEVV